MTESPSTIWFPANGPLKKGRNWGRLTDEQKQYEKLLHLLMEAALHGNQEYAAKIKQAAETEGLFLCEVAPNVKCRQDAKRPFYEGGHIALYNED